MRSHQTFQFTFEPTDCPNVIPSAELQMVALSLLPTGVGCTVWFTPAQIPQLQQLLNVLWAMKQEKDEQERQRFEEIQQVWKLVGNGSAGNGNSNGYVPSTEEF